MRSTRWRTWHATVLGACLGAIVYMIAHGFYGLEANPGTATAQFLAMTVGGAVLATVIAGVVGALGRRRL